MTLSLEQMNIPKLQKVAPTIYRGSTLEKSPQALMALKKSGTQTIVDFRGSGNSVLEKLCKSLNLDFFKVSFDPILAKERKAKGYKQVIDFNALKEFFKIMNRGKAYVGCQLGIHRTNAALTYNYFLNPQAQNAPKLLFVNDTPSNLEVKNEINRLTRMVKQYVKKLTSEQKKSIGLEDNFKTVFDSTFKGKIAQLIKSNLRNIR